MAKLDRRPLYIFGNARQRRGQVADGYRVVMPDDPDYDDEHRAAGLRVDYGARAPYATPEQIEEHSIRARTIALMGEDDETDWSALFDYEPALFSEALSGGHWVTIENEEGETHIYIAGGRIKAGPAHLVGHAAASLHAHAKATGARVTEHKGGKVPTGHNDHPDYHEHQDKIRIHGRWGDGTGIEVDNPLPEKDDKEFAGDLKTAQARKALHDQVKHHADTLQRTVTKGSPAQEILTREHGDEHEALQHAVETNPSVAQSARSFVKGYGEKLKEARGMLDTARGVHEQATKEGLQTEHTARLGANIEAATNQHSRNLMTFNRLKDAVDDAEGAQPPPYDPELDPHHHERGKVMGDVQREHDESYGKAQPYLATLRAEPGADHEHGRQTIMAETDPTRRKELIEKAQAAIGRRKADLEQARAHAGRIDTAVGRAYALDAHTKGAAGWDAEGVQGMLSKATMRASEMRARAGKHQALDEDFLREISGLDNDRSTSPMHKMVESGQTWDHQHLHQLAVRAEQHQSEHNRDDPDNAENRGRLQKLINLLDSPAYLDRMGTPEPSKDVLHEHVAAVHGLLSAQVQRDTESDQRQAKEMRERFLAHDTGYSPQLTLTRDQREQALGQYVPATGNYGTFHVMKGIARAVSDHENVHDGISSGFNGLAGAVALQHYMGHATSLREHDDFSDASSKARAFQDYLKENKSLPKSQEYFDNITHQEGFNARRRAYQQQQELQKLRDREAEQARHGDDMTEQERATRNQNVSKILAAHAANPSPAVPVTRHGKHELHGEAEQTIQAMPGIYKTLTNVFGGTVHFGSPGARGLPDYVKTAQRKRDVHGTNFTRQRESWSFGKGFEHAKVSRETRAKINDPSSGHYIPEDSPYKKRRDYYNDPDNYDWHKSLVSHEYGHLLDDALGHVHGKFGDDRTTRNQGSRHVRRITRSVHDDFSKLYDEHKNNSKLRPYMRENKSEMFAEGYMLHHLRPDELKEAAPSLHAFFEALPDETRKKLHDVQEKYNA